MLKTRSSAARGPFIKVNSRVTMSSILTRLSSATEPLKSSSSSERWRLGLALALVAACCWGVLPIALCVSLQALDPYTITWFRFSTAAIFLGFILAIRNALPRLQHISARTWVLLGIALAGLLGNYVLLLFALTYATPTTVQTLGQLSSVFFLLGGVVIFKERLSPKQWLGFALLLAGLLLFFNHRVPQLRDLSRGLGHGVVITVITTLSWATYGLTQRRLVMDLRSSQVLLLLYVGAAVGLFPVASPVAMARLSRLQAVMLGFSCLNTIVGYGAFAESLRHWKVSRVGAVLATTPLFTFATMILAQREAPSLIPPESLNSLSIFGAVLVVIGAASCALGRVE